MVLERNSVKGLDNKANKSSQFVEMKIKIPCKTEVPI